MVATLNQDERIIGVLDGTLPDSVLTDDDLQTLQERLMDAIIRKRNTEDFIVFSGQHEQVLH